VNKKKRYQLENRVFSMTTTIEINQFQETGIEEGSPDFTLQKPRKGRKRKMNSSLPSRDETIPSECEMCLQLGGRLYQSSPVVRGLLLFIIITNILTFPFTVVLNALTMLAVKVKPRLRAQKTNILLALLALTDFIAGFIGQPVFTAMTIIFLRNESSGWPCALQVVTRAARSRLVDASLLHLALISAERYLAMKHPFAYITLVTKARLLLASILAWVFSLTLRIPLVVDRTTFLTIDSTFNGLSIAFIVFCHVTVYRESRRHEQQIAAQQVTQEAREQFEHNKKALKLTSIILAAIMFCYMPSVIYRITLIRYRSAMSVETVYILSFVTISMVLLNSLFNPIIYIVRLRHFRVAFIELTCRTVSITETEEIEMRVFGAPNPVARLQNGREHEGQNQQSVEQANLNNSDKREIDVLTQQRNSVVERPNDNV